MIPTFIRPVPQILPGTALASSTGIPRGSISFPSAGGFQVVDQTGAVLTIAGVGGALAATVTDTANSTSSTALSLTHALSSGVGAVGVGVTQRFVLPNGVGTLDDAAVMTATYTDVTDGSEDAALAFSLMVAGTLRASLSLTAPSAGTNVLTAAGAANANLALQAAGTGVASLQGSGGANIVAVSTNSAASRLGFFNTTPSVQLTVADCVPAVDGTSAGTQLNALLASLRLFGLLTP